MPTEHDLCEALSLLRVTKPTPVRLHVHAHSWGLIVGRWVGVPPELRAGCTLFPEDTAEDLHDRAKSLLAQLERRRQ